MKCNICPRKCNVERGSSVGFCGGGDKIRIARAALHFYEEPVLSECGGAGAVFFSGCNLKCVYCQNHDISFDNFGQEITPDRLREIYHELVFQGAQNIDLVTPSQYTLQILPTLDEKIGVPFVWNSSAYEDVNTLKLLDGKIQIYLPDFKYMSSSLSRKYSGAPDYPEIAKKAIKEMYSQVGDVKIDEDGCMKSGVIIRHLMLPGELENTLDVIDWVSSTFNGGVLFSLMSQYTPNKYCCQGKLSTRVTAEEYEKAVDYMYLCGIENGFVQELDSAQEKYTPDFDLTGIKPNA